MKHIIFLIILILAFNSGYGRASLDEFLPIDSNSGEFTAMNDTTKKVKSQKKASVKKTLKTDSQQCGNKECGMNRKCVRGKKDQFIDKDGDGINDNRCKGSGLNNCKRKGKRCGKK